MTNSVAKIYIGIDISKAKLDVCFDDKKVEIFENSKNGCKQLSKKLNSFNQTAHVIMEASGGYEKRSHKILTESGVNVSIVNAKLVRHFAKSKGIQAKTDKIDAIVIRRFGIENNPKTTHLPSASRYKLVILSKRRDQLVKLRKQELQHLEKSDTEISKDIEKMLAYIDKQIEKIDAKIKDVLSDDDFKDKAEIIESFKGAGDNAVRILLSDLPELGTLDRKEISMLVGLAPVARDSGTFKGRRSIYGGRARVRRALYLCSLSATRYNPAIKEFYDRLIAKGKLPKVALIACAHKILIMLNAMIKNNEKWEVR